MERRFELRKETMLEECIEAPQVMDRVLPRPIRKVMYTTNLIESVNSVIRKFTRKRKQYPNRDSALKMIYMAINEASKRWIKALRNWKKALNHFLPSCSRTACRRT